MTFFVVVFLAVVVAGLGDLLGLVAVAMCDAPSVVCAGEVAHYPIVGLRGMLRVCAEEVLFFERTARWRVLGCVVTHHSLP